MEYNFLSSPSTWQLSRLSSSWGQNYARLRRSHQYYLLHPYTQPTLFKFHESPTCKMLWRVASQSTWTRKQRIDGDLVLPLILFVLLLQGSTMDQQFGQRLVHSQKFHTSHEFSNQHSFHLTPRYPSVQSRTYTLLRWYITYKTNYRCGKLGDSISGACKSIHDLWETDNNLLVVVSIEGLLLKNFMTAHRSRIGQH
jgi:hypothetical protein